MTRGLALFLLFHAVATTAAGIVLVVAPAAIPRTVGVELDPRAHVVAYLLAGCEFALGALSFFARRIEDRAALRAIVLSFIVLHASTAVLEVVALSEGVGGALLANCVFRVVVTAVLGYFLRGLRAPASTPR